jgi:predicted chitinase
MSWLYLNRNAVWLMAPNTNQFLSKLSYQGKRVTLPLDWWDKRSDRPGTMIISLDDSDPLPYMPPTNTNYDDNSPPAETSFKITGLEKYVQDEPWIYHTFTGQYDRYGFKVFLTQLISNSKVVDRVKTISGSPAAQKRELPHPTEDYSGSGNPIYESIFSIGGIVKMRVQEKGIGFIKIPLEPLPDFRGVNNRSELLIHDDPNRANARGSLGCIVTYTVQDLHKIVRWCEQQNRPRILVVDYGKGLLRDRGIIINEANDTFDGTLSIAKHQAASIFGNTIRDRELKDLNSCLERFEINTPARIRHFMSQIAHESGGLKWMKELASGAAYEGRRDLGNTQPDDGKRYKGAGCLQLTGRANYQALANYIQDARVMEGCDYVAQTYPFTSGGFWWHNNKINTLVDSGASCREISAKVNGRDPAKGLAERERYYAKACQVIN